MLSPRIDLLQVHMRSIAASLLRELHSRNHRADLNSAQQTCNLVSIFGKARQGKSTLMNVMSRTEVRGP